MEPPFTQQPAAIEQRLGLDAPPGFTTYVAHVLYEALFASLNGHPSRYALTVDPVDDTTVVVRLASGTTYELTVTKADRPTTERSGT